MAKSVLILESQMPYRSVRKKSIHFDLNKQILFKIRKLKFILSSVIISL